MTVQDKELLRRALIAGWKLFKAEHLTEAIGHIDELVEVVSDLQEDEKETR